jgi:hypothetical protein
MYDEEPESEHERILAAEAAHEAADEQEQDQEHDPFLTDAEADADALASAGFGTDEDYGVFDDGEGFMGDDYVADE